MLGESAGAPSLRRRVGDVTQAPAVYGDLSVAENVLRLEPLAPASADELVPLLAPTLQRYLTAELGAPPVG